VSDKPASGDAIQSVAIGVDIGGTGIKAAIVGLSGLA